MLYFNIPSIERDLSTICGFTQSENEWNNRRALKRWSDNQRLTSPAKQSKSEGFSVKLDVIHFKPEEIAIKVVNNELVVTGSHSERVDANGSYVSRQFTRRYELPKDIDLDRISSKVSKEGKLAIEAPLKPKEEPIERVIPITFETQKTTEDKEKSVENNTS